MALPGERSLARARRRLPRRASSQAFGNKTKSRSSRKNIYALRRGGVSEHLFSTSHGAPSSSRCRGEAARARIANPLRARLLRRGVLIAFLLLLSRSGGLARAETPRPLVVSDLSDRTYAGLSLTFGQALCAICPASKIETTALVALAFADIAVRPRLKLWFALPVVRRHDTASEFLSERTYIAFGQLTVGLRQMWDVGSAWPVRLSAGASFSGTRRTGAGGEAELTLAAARLTSGLQASYFSVATTTTRLHGDLALARGPVFGQLGLALMLRAPDERELRSELAFEALLGVQASARVAVLAELTAAVFDQSLLCQSTCAPELTGFTSLVSGNLGVRVALGRVALGGRLVLPLTGDPSPPLGGVTGAPRASVSPALSVDALARF